MSFGVSVAAFMRYLAEYIYYDVPTAKLFMTRITAWHKKTADDGLSVPTMRVRFGGNVPGPAMRDSLLTEQ